MANENSHTGVGQFLQPFPWWYKPVTWLLPLSVALLSALFIASITTGMIAVPSIISGLGALAVLYTNLEAIGAFTLLSIAMATTATLAGLATIGLIRVSLFGFVENLAYDNLQRGQHYDQFRKLFIKEVETEELKQYQEALVNADNENQRLRQQLDIQPPNPLLTPLRDAGIDNDSDIDEELEEIVQQPQAEASNDAEDPLLLGARANDAQEQGGPVTRSRARPRRG